MPGVNVNTRKNHGNPLPLLNNLSGRNGLTHSIQVDQDDSVRHRILLEKRALFWRRIAELHACHSTPVFHPRYESVKDRMNRDLKLLKLRGYSFEVALIYESILDASAFFRALSDLLEKSTTTCNH